MSIIYEPKGAAREYCELALNIYTGCTNGCYYCYAPTVLHKHRDNFHAAAILRPTVTPERVVHEITSRKLQGRTIQLCFTCDPYPAHTNTAPTREIIRAIKDSGANVQILTKNPESALRDIDLLTPEDSFGTTLTALDPDSSIRWEPNAELPQMRLNALLKAHADGIKTWVSFEPVVDAGQTADLLYLVIQNNIADVVKIGKMNYADTPNLIDWAKFGRYMEKMCKNGGQKYYIKDGLRKEIKP